MRAMLNININMPIIAARIRIIFILLIVLGSKIPSGLRFIDTKSGVKYITKNMSKELAIIPSKAPNLIHLLFIFIFLVTNMK